MAEYTRAVESGYTIENDSQERDAESHKNLCTRHITSVYVGSWSLSVAEEVRTGDNAIRDVKSRAGPLV